MSNEQEVKSSSLYVLGFNKKSVHKVYSEKNKLIGNK